MAKEAPKDEEPVAPEEHDEDDVYEADEVEQELDDDEVSEREAGFMEGYDRDRNKEKQKKKT
ncbi:TPA: hypothetical protein HA281_03295 [Candidatus Woesearchaeota archaeon]|nr:MAG: hypothetical protein QT04_C0044G0006 [archaeon GW2011_AR11]MBS3110514.1 hypothetical protein [Candidatus Woesearchaeota archaeon]HIH05447.1 hypothetical protein [Candidatus Woesearchaeota archaeon]HIH91801.1 hypothetical protein [Candidatus Woesearchaeota archaeon]HII65059.1 hypothetical protein [Candidatus Woesearchaeota archaeon]